MKNSVNIFICFLVLLTGGLKAEKNSLSRPDTSLCLEIEGKILNAHEGPDTDCKVELLIDDEVVDSIHLKGSKRKFKFGLKRNLHYTVRLSKNGYISRTVCIRTNLPSSYSETYKFVFETKLDEATPAKQNHIRQTDHVPVARIFFDEKRECLLQQDPECKFTEAIVHCCALTVAIKDSIIYNFNRLYIIYNLRLEKESALAISLQL